MDESDNLVWGGKQNLQIFISAWISACISACISAWISACMSACISALNWPENANISVQNKNQ